MNHDSQVDRLTNTCVIQALGPIKMYMSISQNDKLVNLNF